MFYLYYVYNDGSGNLTLKRRKSTNGILWDPEETCTVSDLANVGSPAVVRRSSTEWYLYGTVAEEMVRYSSIDGLAWNTPVKIATNRMGTTWDHTVFVDTYGLHFLTVSAPLNNTLRRQNVHYGVAKDLRGPIVYDSVPLFQPASTVSGDWRDNQIYTSSLVQIDDDLYRVYMSARNNANVWSIGYVDCRMRLDTVNYPGRGSEIRKRYGTLAAGITETLVTVTDKATICGLTLATDYAVTWLYLEPRKSDGTYDSLSLLGNDGASVNSISVSNLRILTKDEHWEALVDDTAGDKYKLALKAGKLLSFPNGFRLRVYNPDAVGHNVAVQVIYSIEW